jgi:hypothetical protein
MTEQKWTKWAGGKFLPVSEDAIGEVRLRGGKVLVGIKAGDVLWGRARREVAANDNYQNPGEVIAYSFDGEAA